MISHRFTLGIIIFLSLSFLLSFQTALALPPVMSYLQFRNRDGEYLNPDNLPVYPNDPSVSVTFTYRGLDDNQQVTYFVCAWRVGSMPASGDYNEANCRNKWVEPRMMQRGPDGMIRNYYSAAGTVTSNRPFTTSTTFFGVKAVNQAGTQSQPVLGIFGMVRIPSGAGVAYYYYPPRIDIAKHAVSTGRETIQIPNLGSTPLHHMIFTFWITSPLHPERAYFDCTWDNGPRIPCGHPLSPYPGASQMITDVSDGYHSVTVRGWYAGSPASYEQRFTWCVSRTGGCVSNSETPGWTAVVAPSAPSGGVPPAGINESSVIPDAGLNKIIIENETAKLSGAIVAANSSIVNKTTPIDMPLLWKQVEGPKVKLNSSNTHAVEFLAPSVKNDTFLKFTLTVTDPKGINATDTSTLFLVTKENAQKYKGAFCDVMVRKALEQINYPSNITLDGKDKNDNKSAQTNMERAGKYLSECEGPLNQYAHQLGNITKIFPPLNFSAPVGINATTIGNLTEIFPAAVRINATTINK